MKILTIHEKYPLHNIMILFKHLNVGSQGKGFYVIKFKMTRKKTKEMRQCFPDRLNLSMASESLFGSLSSSLSPPLRLSAPNEFNSKARNKLSTFRYNSKQCHGKASTICLKKMYSLYVYANPDVVVSILCSNI